MLCIRAPIRRFLKVLLIFIPRGTRLLFARSSCSLPLKKRSTASEFAVWSTGGEFDCDLRQMDHC